MSVARPFVLSIAGLDPSSGAGLLADVKCFEQHRVYGFGVCSAMTVQSDTEFLELQWTDTDHILAQLRPLLRKFHVSAAKIGLIRDIDTLSSITTYLRKSQPEIKIVLDPILKTSAGFKFHSATHEPLALLKALKQLNLITPNYEEAQAYAGTENVDDFCRRYSRVLPILLKGGHHPGHLGIDYLFQGNGIHEIAPDTKDIHQKHGSGCVLSAAITANLALGNNLPESCRLAKHYTEAFLNSNPTLLGYHF